MSARHTARTVRRALDVLLNLPPAALAVLAERMIDRLDAAGQDPEAEPSLGWEAGLRTHPRLWEGYSSTDRECDGECDQEADGDDEPDADAEPSGGCLECCGEDAKFPPRFIAANPPPVTRAGRPVTARELDALEMRRLPGREYGA